MRATALLGLGVGCFVAVTLMLVAKPACADPVKYVNVAPVRGTVTTERERRVKEQIARELKRAGLALASKDADAVLETMVVDDGDGCTVKVSFRVVATGATTDASSQCRGGPALPLAEQVDAATREAVGSVLVLAVTGAAQPSEPLPIATSPPPRPPLPTLPPPPPVAAIGPGNGWVFETGVDLDTSKFVGLGHAVLGTDRTKVFRGVFALTAVHSNLEDFSGAFAFTLGKHESKTFRGALAVGLMTNELDQFGGLAAIGIRKTTTRRFVGITQVTVGWNEAKRFAGLAQVGGINSAGEAATLAQVGAANFTERMFVGGAQVGVVNVASHDFMGLAQVGVANVSVDGTLHAVTQASLVNVVERDVQVAVQAGSANMFGRFRGGAQVGLVNLLGSKTIGDYFGSSSSEATGGDFEGGLEVGMWNATYGAFEGGAQLGVFNLDRGGFRGALQVALAIDIVSSDFDGVLEIAPGNIVDGRFSGLSQIGGGNLARDLEGSQLGVTNNVLHGMRGAQVGIVNVADDARGVQVGLVNRAERLRGVQIGVVNWIAGREVLPVLPVLNLGM